MFFHLNGSNVRHHLFQRVKTNTTFILGGRGTNILRHRNNKNRFAARVMIRLRRLFKRGANLDRHRHTSMRTRRVMVVGVPNDTPTENDNYHVRRGANNLTRNTRKRVVILYARANVRKQVRSITTNERPRRMVNNCTMMINTLSRGIRPTLPGTFFMVKRRYLTSTRVTNNFFLTSTPLPARLTRDNNRLTIFLHLINFALTRNTLNNFNPPFRILSLFFSLFRILTLSLRLFVRSRGCCGRCCVSTCALYGKLFCSIGGLWYFINCHHYSKKFYVRIVRDLSFSAQTRRERPGHAMC